MDKRHDLHSQDGCIGGGSETTPADVDAMVQALCEDPRRHLVLHFHGGLVCRESGLAIAEKLRTVYSPQADQGGYPIFFIWESGFLETLRNNLTELADEPVFKELLLKVVQYALEKLGGCLPGMARTVPQAGCGRQGEEVRRAFEAFWQAPSWETLPFESFAPIARGSESRAVAQGINPDEILADLESDPAFCRAFASLPGLPEPARAALSQRAEIRDTAFGRHASALFEVEGHQRGVISLFKAALFLARVLKEVLSRYAEGRDHGRYATCVEELLRAFKVVGSGIGAWGQALQWNRMKQDTLDAFGPDPDRHAGTALLSRLKSALGSGALKLDRITLVGHSTGAIYIAHWLKHSASFLPPGLPQDVIYLAPAITYDLFAQTLTNGSACIRNFRMFAMRDDLERQDQVIGCDPDMKDGHDWKRFIYPSSLLYLVSGLLETRPDAEGHPIDVPDMPLMGMQRFFADTATYPDARFPAIHQVRAWSRGQKHPFVWSRTTGEPAGRTSESTDHGMFDDDPSTLNSLQTILTRGF